MRNSLPDSLFSASSLPYFLILASFWPLLSLLLLASLFWFRHHASDWLKLGQNEKAERKWPRRG